MQKSKNNNQQISPILLLGNSHVRKTALAAAAIKHVGESYQFNSKFFEDFIDFNFCNGQKYQKTQKEIVSPGNLPTEIRKKVMKLYAKFKKYPIAKVFAKLNIPITLTNKNSPLETKWAFEYYKKFNTWEYHAKNRVSSYEILRPLSSAAVAEFIEIF